MISSNELVLVFDDTGARDLTKKVLVRQDSMDCFGLGGIIYRKSDESKIVNLHKDFCTRWLIDYPLHSYQIRGNRKKFGWLGNAEKKAKFLCELELFLLSLPVVVIGSIIHRPGYYNRYFTRHKNSLWHMDKTAFCILVERALKFAKYRDCSLRIYFEGAGKTHDSRIKIYARDLMNNGSPFNNENESGYFPLTAEDYRNLLVEEPRQLTKKAASIQIADLMLYPIARAKYVDNDRAYKSIKSAGLLIDDHVAEAEIYREGIKYSCFDDI